MIDRILITTDGSDEAEPAVNYGLDLAELAGAEVHALYVVETEAAYVITVDLDDDAMDEHKEYGEKTVTEIIRRAADRNLEGAGAVKSGKIAPEIVDYANKEGIDHIVVGRQGRGAIEQYLGSTAEKVIRMSEQPVTVVRSS